MHDLAVKCPREYSGLLIIVFALCSLVTNDKSEGYCMKSRKSNAVLSNRVEFKAVNCNGCTVL